MTSFDWLSTPPSTYNAAAEFIDKHIHEGRGGKTAYIDDTGEYSYQQLVERVNRAGNALRELGLQQEDRIAMLMLDSIDFPAVFWGAIKTGMAPVAINTLLTTDQYLYILSDCRARALIVSAALYEKIQPILGELSSLKHVIVSGNAEPFQQNIADLCSTSSSELDCAVTSSDEVAFWLYSSGSTGQPKGVKHVQSSLAATAELYGKKTLGMREDDVVYSAAKLFFAYGLGNAMSFPLYCGATTILLAERPTPDAVMNILRNHRPSVFFGVPTLFAAILANEENNRDSGSDNLRLCASAGEALPEDIGAKWQQRFGAPVLDGIGSTEMLHIFLSNRPENNRYGSTGKPMDGYHVRLVDENNHPVSTGEIGELLVCGPSVCDGYWNQRAKSANTFMGAWTRTGDKFYLDDEGYYHYCGRTDDMFKVSGNWVSPFEIESALMTHESVLEAGVVAWDEGEGLLKPRAYVVLKENLTADEVRYQDLKDHVKHQLAPWKYPRWIDYVDELPKTATGKIQRFKLRELAAL